MRLSATGDVPDDRLAMLASDLRELVQVDVDEARTGYKSVEPRSWIVLLERIPTWAAILGPSAAVFLKELLKEAAKDTYWNKAAIGRALARPVVGQDEYPIAVELALFIKHGGGIQAVLDDVQRDGKHVIGQITLTLLPDGTMQAQWMDGDAEIRTTKFPPPPP